MKPYWPPWVLKSSEGQHPATQSMRLLLLAFAHHCYLLETVSEGKTGKTTGMTSCGYQGKFAIALMWTISFFCQCLQGSVRGHRMWHSRRVASWRHEQKFGRLGFFFLQVLHFFFFPIDLGKVLCNFPVTLIMQLGMAAALADIKDATLIRWQAAPARRGTPRRHPAVPGADGSPGCLV